MSDNRYVLVAPTPDEMVCRDCGALVRDCIWHDAFHDRIDQIEDVLLNGPQPQEPLPDEPEPPAGTPVWWDGEWWIKRIWFDGPDTNYYCARTSRRPHKWPNMPGAIPASIPGKEADDVTS